MALEQINGGINVNLGENRNRQEQLKTLSYRLNLANMYLLRNLCDVAGLDYTPISKYPRHDNKSYLDMKKKNIRQEALRDRLDTQRAIIKMLETCENGTIDLVISDLEQHLRADGRYIPPTSPKGGFNFV